MIKSKAEYTTYEFVYSNEDYDEIIIKAYVSLDSRLGEYVLNISLKTKDDIGLEHFVVGYCVENTSEIVIKREVMRLAECGYFDVNIELALRDEEYLEEMFEEDFRKD